MTETNPHMESKINALIAEGVTYSELVYMLQQKDVERVEIEARLEARIAELEAALEVFADEENWMLPDDILPFTAFLGGDPMAIAREALGDASAAGNDE